MFKVGKRYRHVSCLDIDIDIIGYLGESDELISIIVAYWNRQMKGYQGSRSQAVSVKKSELSKWSEISKEENE